jgi:GAF domain-containing protein
MSQSDFFHRYSQALNDIHASFDMEKTQGAVVRHATSLFDGRGANLLLTSANLEKLLVSTSFGLSESYRNKGDIDPRKSLGETLDKTPVIVRNVATDPRIQFPDAAIREGIGAIVGLPLAAGSALVGSLRIYFPRPRDFDLETLSALQAFSTQAGLALKKAFYFESMKVALTEIQSMPMTTSKEALNIMLKIVATYGMAKGSGLLMVDRKTNTLTSVVRYGLSDQYIQKGPLLAGSSLGEVVTGRPVIISQVASDPRIQYKEAAKAENIQAILGLPVWIGDGIGAVLRLYYSFEFEPDADYILWMEHLALHMGIAIEKNQMMVMLKERSDWYEDVLRDMER